MSKAPRFDFQSTAWMSAAPLRYCCLEYAKSTRSLLLVSLGVALPFEQPFAGAPPRYGLHGAFMDKIDGT